jgi:predicted O-linked N-acetylglucosamine transferase (SPINDLY family)
MQKMTPLTQELALLLRCARVVLDEEDPPAIRHMLEKGVDWSKFAQKAVDHGLVGLAGQTLKGIAPDLVPADILDACDAVIAQTRSANQGLFDELARLMDAFAQAGIPAIPFKGPVLALKAYGDLGLRTFRDLDFLVQDADLSVAIGRLRELGYERQADLTDSQLEITHWIQGQEVMFREAGTCIEPHTRLTSIRMALNIDHAGLWARARRTTVNGRVMLIMAPEDEFIVLAIHGGKELWWNIKWACDASAFLAAHPDLDWRAIMDRARSQGCLRMVLLAVALARAFFDARIPPAIIEVEHADSAISPMVGRILASWQEEGVEGPVTGKTVSLDRLRLHDGIFRQASYVARTWFLPGPHHAPLLSVPKQFRFLYVPVKVAHDVIALPLWRMYQRVQTQMDQLPQLNNSEFALAMGPASSDAQLALKRHQMAQVEAKRALAINPNNAKAWRNLGRALSGLKQHEEAIACYDNALKLAPDNMNYWAYRRAALTALGKADDATAFGTDPQDADAWAVYAGRLMFSQRLAEAIDATDHALALDPGNISALRMGIQARLHSCDWRRREDDKRKINEAVEQDLPVISPLFHRAIIDSEEAHLELTQQWGKGLSASPEKLWRGEKYKHDKIRLAYISTDFRDHVVADAIIGCLENHDRNRFELTAVCLGPNDRSEMRRRIEGATDRFFEAQATQDADVAIAMREWEIDIAIDLNGMSGERRSGILARRAAPVQVNYLGYPGTMGLPFMDYIIADRTIIPEENRAGYLEQVVYMPHTYLPNDPRRRVGDIPSRVEAGLPQTGFVFACLNQNYKISPEIFEVWIRLLRAVEGSVLWLQGSNGAAVGNLRREARAQGVAPERLIFKPRQQEAKDYLARLKLADLFLDTLPYNAHATASDTLCLGVPLVTCLGRAFPGRVAASVLQAAGLPELVTHSLAQYEELARSLATNGERLAAVRAKLERNRLTEPLFDAKRFTRDLEVAYTTMWERQQAGKPPAHFAVGS